MADPLIDSTVAHYQVLARLGSGAMGVVYKARDTKLGRLVALKFLPPEWSHDEDAKQRFVREAQAASSTDHANICTVHDIQSTDDGRLFIVMAYYEGQTLKQRLAAGPLTVQDALAVATQVADGLARAHAAGVVHRDIKPGNVILTEDAVKIVDFGLAKFADSLQLTQVGALMGTVAYMSPEQLRGHEATAQSDVWAVGVMLYEMLSGHPPFQGGYAEAISYAIRHETPAPLRLQRPEVSEEVEQLVFRALHREPGVRFTSGRELARALRQVQGHSVPIDLQTAAIDVPRRLAASSLPRRRRWRVLAAAAGALAIAGGALAWMLLRPVPRTFIAVAPVANQTGDATLEPYRLGLTLAFTRELAGSHVVRVWPYRQLLQPLRRFLQGGPDVSSLEAVRAVAATSGAPVVVVPTLLYEAGAWKARAELQRPGGNTVSELIETDPLESSLTKETAATLIASLALKVEQRFDSRRWWFRRERSTPERFQSLDAAQAFEEGVNAYDAAEYSSARAAFLRAAREDPRHPLPRAWVSRVAHIVGDRNAAAEAGDRAEERLEGASDEDRLFIEAVVAEVRRREDEAEQRYVAFAASSGDDPAGLMELAGFLDRRGKTAESIATYRRVLDLDGRLAGPALELCRLYNSTRMNDAAMARAFGERAQRSYQDLGSPVGAAQAMLCLSDTLRVGNPGERAQARVLAAQALAIFEARGLQYGVGRAQQYVASAARAVDDLPAAAAALEKALASAKAVGNTSLEGTVYINLGVTYTALGQRANALVYYRQSYELAERRGDERRAAYSRANAGALLIEYGGEAEEGLRFVEGALGVVRRLQDKNFEVFCLQIVAAHYRFTGRATEARRRIAQAMAIARERNFVDAIPGLMLDDGRALMQLGDFVQARDTFMKALASEGATETGELLIELGRVRARLGDFDGASEALSRTKTTRDATAGDMAPRLAAAFGEVAYASGRMPEARASFDAASRMWTDELPDAASVEARAYVGLIDGLQGRSGGRRAIEASLQQAVRMKRPVLEATCRVLLAQVELRDGRPAQAAAALSDVRMEALGPELKAQVHHWRAEVQAALGAAGSGQPALEQDRREARRLLDEMQRGVPPELRERYLSRPDLQGIASLGK
jgi:tRNA A-37 threonylcarbamoyl transferase component Bud32/tetratricopeptide (TPR) repeat protein